MKGFSNHNRFASFPEKEMREIKWTNSASPRVESKIRDRVQTHMDTTNATLIEIDLQYKNNQEDKKMTNWGCETSWKVKEENVIFCKLEKRNWGLEVYETVTLELTNTRGIVNEGMESLNGRNEQRDRWNLVGGHGI